MTMTIKDMTLSAEGRRFEDPEGPRATIEKVEQQIDETVRCVPLEGEPSFTLLARDPVAPHLLLIWAAVRQRYEAGAYKNHRAQMIAVDMVRWKDAHPDVGMPKPEDPSLGHVLAEEEARVHGHSYRLQTLRIFSMQDLFRRFRDFALRYEQVKSDHDIAPHRIFGEIARVVNYQDAFKWYRSAKGALYAKILDGVELKTDEPLMEGARLTVYIGDGGKPYARVDREFAEKYRDVKIDSQSGDLIE